MKRAVYAGSFDPFTFGHLSVALNAAKIFDEVVILIAVNSSKTYMFSVEERKAMIEKVIESFDRITVGSTDGYVVAFAGAHDSSFMVRGIRNETDAMSELALAELNSALDSSIQTVFIPSNPTLSNVSSSELKRRFEAGENISMYCPPEVINALKHKAESKR